MNQSIVFVLSWGLSGISGVVSWIQTIREELRGRGVDAVLLLGQPSPDRSEWGDVDAVFRSPEELEETLARFSPGVVVLMNKTRHLAFGPVTQRLNRDGRRFRVISVLHADSFEEYYRCVPEFEPFTHHFIGVSPTIHGRIRDGLGTRGEEACSLLPYGVPLPDGERRGYSSAPLRLAYAGRLVHHQKRVLDFPRLVERMLARDVDFSLTFAGHGRDEDELRAKLEPYRETGRIRFIGRRPHPEMLRRWLDFDVFVNLSAFEGTSVAMLEAMAAGCVPVVTEASSGVREVVDDGRNGFHVPVGDMDALAVRLQEIALSPARLPVMGQRAIETVRRAYTLEEHTERFLRIVDDVVRASRSRAGDAAPGGQATVAGVGCGDEGLASET